jgi:hypothetical protein
LFCYAGAGFKELKALLLKHFGKVSHSKMGPLQLLDANDTSVGTAKATDLVDGAKVRCTYTYAPGNMMNLAKGGFGFGGYAVAVSASGIEVPHVLQLSAAVLSKICVEMCHMHFARCRADMP